MSKCGSTWSWTGEAAIIYDIYVIHGCCITDLASVLNRRTELSTCRTNLRSSKTDDMGPNGAWLRVRRAKSAPCAFHASHTHHVGPYYRSPMVLGWLFTLITHSCGLERSIPPPVSKIKSPRTREALVKQLSYMVYMWYIVVTVRLHYGRKPRERVANGQNKPKIINNRLDGAKWCLVAHGTC